MSLEHNDKATIHQASLGVSVSPSLSLSLSALTFLFMRPKDVNNFIIAITFLVCFSTDFALYSNSRMLLTEIYK